MNQDDKDEMQPEYDMRGAVRGKYLARYQRWAGLTTATGPVILGAVSTGEPYGNGAKIVLRITHDALHVAFQAPRTIAPEASSVTAHAD
jgi:hypothetical protein